MNTLFENLFRKDQVDYVRLIENGALIIDVRTPEEFAEEHMNGCVNIRLSDIPQRIRQIQKLNRPVITCCRSGARAGNAAAILKSYGIEAYNGGRWHQVQKNIKRECA